MNAGRIKLTTASRINPGLYRLVRLGSGAITKLKSVVRTGRAGSTPALGTNDVVSSLAADHLKLSCRIGSTQFAQCTPIELPY